MSIPVSQKLDFGNARRITNLAPAAAAGEAVVYEQLQAAIENIAWKDDVRVMSTANVTVASPGAAIDGVTLAAGDRVGLKNQTSQPENGIYIWNGAAVPMTRALDASTFDELESAVVTVSEGTANGGSTWRQTQVNGVIGTNNVVWTSFGTSAPAASETVAGIAEIATQAETDTGTDDVRVITPLKLANWSLRPKRFSSTYGDASATSILVTHNLGTDDTEVYVRETGGSKRMIICEVQHTSTNSVTLVFDTAPALNSIRCTVLG
jgi:hypothetical protein